MNASDVIDDRIVLEAGNVQYLACIVPDFDPVNPLKDWDQSVSFYVPHWDYQDRSRAHVADLLNGEDAPDVDTYRVSQRLRDKTEDCSWYEESHAADWLELYRRADPSGLYFIVQWNDSGYGDTLKFADDDDDSTRDYAIAYRTSAQIREDHMVRRITKTVREQAESNIRADVKTQNAYFAGDVYGYYTLRQVLDEDGETIESEEIEEGSCWGYYGSDEWEYMYSEAKAAAERDHARREEEQSSSRLSLDLFDAASYPDPTMHDVAGAYQARLNEGIAAIGECTRTLREESSIPWTMW